MTQGMRRRLNAFTLLELMVVMVISALLLSMAYTALHLVQRQQAVIERKTAILSQVSAWQEALNSDFYASTEVLLGPATDRVSCQRPAGIVAYTLVDSTLVREQGEVVDTLRVPVRQVAYFWQGQPRTAGLIDEVALLTVVAKDTFYLQARARYTAQQLVASLPLPAQ